MTRGHFSIIGGILICLLAGGLLHAQERQCTTVNVATQPGGNQQEGQIVTQRSWPSVPVVFHIISRLPESDFSDLEVQAQLDVLNRDFQLRGENLGRVPEEFRELAAPMDIRFCLAAEDPAGNPSTGIIRRQTSIPDIGSAFNPEGRRRIHYDFLGGSDAWDPERYVNIWVGEMEGVIGFATFPNQAPFPEEDGIIIDPAYFGTLRPAGQTGANRGHTLTHEMGHYLNLQHLWGANDSACEEDDQVEDTPIQSGPHFGCPAHPVVSCGTPDMFMNFMDFTNDACLAFFTVGQVSRMAQSLEYQRTTLGTGLVVCHEPETTVPPDLESKLITSYLPERKVILARLMDPFETRVEISCYTIDGRQVAEYDLEGEYTLLIPTRGIPGGFLVLWIRTDSTRFSRKIVLY